MAAEIERKFLPAALPAEASGATAMAIEQGYLELEGATEVRLRRAGDALRLTVKSGAGEVREEVEIELTADQFDALWPLSEGRRIRKTRLLVPLGHDLTAEIDRYEGALTGLLTAEVEFRSVAASRAWAPPAWFGREVTGERAWSNRALALDGRPTGLDPGAASGETGAVPIPEDKPDPPEELKRGPAAYRLEPDEPASEGIRRVAAGRAVKALKKLDEVSEDGAEAVHGTRKDLKKIRAVLRLARPALGKKRYRAQNAAYRDAGRLLSDSRDAEIKVETLDDLEERFGDEFPGAVAEPWRRDLERERYAAAADAGGELGGRVEQAAALIAEAAASIPDWPLADDSFDLVAPGLLKAYADGREELAQVRKKPSDDAVHEWRKRAKDLWYHLRILRELWPEVLGETADQAHALADLLGDHHDLAVLAEDLRGRDTIDPDAIRTLIERRQEELLERAIGLGQRLYAEKPKVFGKRIRRYWKIARA
jgi:CYTH domain-containing protein/CHAD domain-containing protein